MKAFAETPWDRRKSAPENFQACELEDAIDHLDLRGTSIPPTVIREKREALDAVSGHLRNLATYVQKLNDDGFNVWTYVKPYSEEQDIPGSVTVILERNDERETLYEQVFNSFFIENLKLDNYPSTREGFEMIVRRARMGIEKRESEKRKPPTEASKEKIA